ncbi:MAG: prolipoprotein diacylglyceryl transferase, partial [Oceanicaulis sp.]|nr:prolipoprotein diacylglyceryl transferase [Oceanicaulis sp.]
GVIAGGRIGFVLFYQTSMIWEEPLRVITGITQGGMSFHGGLIGVALAMYFTARAHKAPLLRVADAVALATPIGLLLGRLANFINGELWGRPAPDLPWAMTFEEYPLCLARHPSQLYEAFLEGAVLLAILSVLVWRFRALARPGLVTGAFLLGYGVFRAAVELVREPDRHMPEALQGYVTMGMLLCIPMILAGAYLVWRARNQPPAKA